MSEPHDRDYWETLRGRLCPEGRALIDGRLVEAAGGTFEKITPIDARPIAMVADGDATDADHAVAAARRAFEDGRWRGRPPDERKAVLLALADLVREHAEELALLEALDTGRPITDALGVDLPHAAGCLQFYGECADKLYDQVAPSGPGDLVLVRREPLGVVAAIVPWNYPLILAAWKVGPALVSGNSVVLKPAEQSPLTAVRLGQLALEAGLPPGVLNVLPGHGEGAGRALALHGDVDLVSFTGSTAVGRELMRCSGDSNLKRVSLECGGKSPQVVLPDCADLDAAAHDIAWSVYYNQGQTCHAGTRLLVHESLQEPLLERVQAVAAGLRLGHPLDPETQVGAMVDRVQMERVLDYMHMGRSEGARLRMGGRRVLEESGGFYLEPTLFDRVQSGMRIAQEEIFGPVLAAITFRDEAEAVAIAGDSAYGLAAGVWTSDMDAAHRLSQALRAGTVWVNTYDRASMATPTGGFKQSGFGRDRSLHAIDKYTDLKTVWTAYR